jgi:hypothetical protein
MGLASSTAPWPSHTAPVSAIPHMLLLLHNSASNLNRVNFHGTTAADVKISRQGVKKQILNTDLPLRYDVKINRQDLPLRYHCKQEHEIRWFELFLWDQRFTT